MKKKLLSLLLLFVGLQLVAQTVEKTFIMLIESRVKDTDVYKKNNPTVRKGNAKVSELGKKAQQMRTVVRIDYLTRVPIQ